MKNADVIAKNLLENKICTGCKYYSPIKKKCQKFKSITLQSTDDIEVYVNGMIVEQNEAYVIKDKIIFILQHNFDQNILNNPMNGYNIMGGILTTYDKVVIKERMIEDGKIKKITHNLSLGEDIPHEQTCENFLDMTKNINYRS